MSNSQENKNNGQDKETTIVVNGRQKTVTSKMLTFDEVVALAFDNPPTGENVLFTITYQRGMGNKPEGSLTAGEEVKVKEGMIFNVTSTNRS
jgi:hypothetical protein